ncbi:hypothetical protein DLAC_01264 [Tieghemostelium lacteum]|uniref:Uncharacterized protein n=1 Tax=Tieghemostelium lacteum TaxID=361077 RepID=A0A152A8A6_TIELA|nr:hypothetical protein DLAC_01264 [Tieghemostelium lacteum]|eukprot:KYR02424.1 hypothetical protein DLAC_01264 [Tieghemostelium lacteum]
MKLPSLLKKYIIRLYLNSYDNNKFNVYFYRYLICQIGLISKEWLVLITKFYHDVVHLGNVNEVSLLLRLKNIGFKFQSIQISDKIIKAYVGDSDRAFWMEPNMLQQLNNEMISLVEYRNSCYLGAPFKVQNRDDLIRNRSSILSSFNGIFHRDLTTQNLSYVISSSLHFNSTLIDNIQNSIIEFNTYMMTIDYITEIQESLKHYNIFKLKILHLDFQKQDHHLNSQLTSLSLINAIINQDTYNSLLRCNMKLQEFKIFTDSGLKFFSEDLTKHPNLISVSINTKTPQKHDHIISYLNNNSLVKTLEIMFPFIHIDSELTITNQTLTSLLATYDSLLRFWGSQHSIKTLLIYKTTPFTSIPLSILKNIESLEINESSIYEICRIIQLNSPSLTSININSYSVVGHEQIVDALEKNNHIIKLNLSGNFVNHAIRLKHPTLRHLSCSRIDVIDFHSVGNNTTLESIEIYFNEYSRDKNEKELFSALLKNVTLKSINSNLYSCGDDKVKISRNLIKNYYLHHSNPIPPDKLNLYSPISPISSWSCCM